MKKVFATFILLTGSLLPQVASAHCPLCTAGAGALAVLAASLGLSEMIVGVLIGAFSLALGLWLAPLITKKLGQKYIPYQNPLLVAIIFLGTVIPIMPLVQAYGPLYIPFLGEYGTTYTINLYLAGVVVGALVVFVSPVVSRFISRKRRRTIPYQGLSLTLILLVIVSIIIQLAS